MLTWMTVCEGWPSRKKLSYEATCQKLKEQYDGYHFTEKSEGLYNPFCLLSVFNAMTFDNYWFKTGTPDLLVELLKHSHYNLYEMANFEAGTRALISIDPASKDPLPIIYQSGYLTIKGYEPEFGLYKLGFPNREVEEGFVKYLFPHYININALKVSTELKQLVREVESGNYDAFFRRLQSFFADTPLRGDHRAKTGTGHGTALPKCTFHRLPTGRAVYQGGISHLEWPY